ncbi:MAG TPA: sugar phosphate isomerase/epimerase [Planctomycetota bacterium]|nr:sugar phosphate isomerase/epimerase [Planctomycetota bacterium]
MTTRTGAYPIGFRRGNSDWQNDTKAWLAWAKASGFAHLDLKAASREELSAVAAAGLGVGSIDLIDFGKLMVSDGGKRKELIARNVAHIKEMAAAGPKVFFTCVIPDDPTRPRAENYALALEVFAPIAQAADEAGATIAIEGWPGRAPHYWTLCCTPETVRSFIRDLRCRSIGINYDPSHLIRLGVDHIRFLNEFVERVWHVHAKDTEIIPEAVYEYGLYQSGVFAKNRVYGELAWRYTIPGSGCTRWTEVLKILSKAGYKGKVSIELEDENFFGTEDAEKAGLLHSLAFMRGV